MAVTFKSPSKPLDLEDMLVRRLDANRLRVPPYPAVALKLQALAESGKCTTRDLSQTISADASLVAAVLRRANSAASGAACIITSLETATSRIGIEQLIRIALAQSVGNVANANGPLAELRRDAWRRSLLAARMCTALAESRRMDPNVAFVAGLLHDIGAITILVGLEDLQVELPVLRASQWRTFVEKLQPRFGAVVAQRWQLPESITDAIGHCTQAHGYAGEHGPLVDLLATVVMAIAMLDRAPDAGVAALVDVPGLSRAEAQQIGNLVPEIAAFMSTFEAPQVPRPDPRSAIAPMTTSIDVVYPATFLIMHRTETYTAVGITANTVMFTGVHPLAANWLAPLVLQCKPEPLEMLANVKSCMASPDGSFTIIAQPFGIDGPDKKKWFALLAHLRAR
jgi:HD-like signal output (HDOD) protein